MNFFTVEENTRQKKNVIATSNLDNSVWLIVLSMLSFYLLVRIRNYSEMKTQAFFIKITFNVLNQQMFVDDLSVFDKMKALRV